MPDKNWQGAKGSYDYHLFYTGDQGKPKVECWNNIGYKYLGLKLITEKDTSFAWVKSIIQLAYCYF